MLALSIDVSSRYTRIFNDLFIIVYAQSHKNSIIQRVMRIIITEHFTFKTRAL